MNSIAHQSSNLTLSVAYNQRLNVTRSESYNFHGNYYPDKAHDGNYDTWYCVKDGEVAGNFLKLYLSDTYSIGEVFMVSRSRNGYRDRFMNTEMRVYSTEGGEVEVASCGTITGNFFGTPLFQTTETVHVKISRRIFPRWYW